jgi:hypothetical protein
MEACSSRVLSPPYSSARRLKWSARAKPLWTPHDPIHSPDASNSSRPRARPGAVGRVYPAPAHYHRRGLVPSCAERRRRCQPARRRALRSRTRLRRCGRRPDLPRARSVHHGVPSERATRTCDTPVPDRASGSPARRLCPPATPGELPSTVDIVTDERVQPGGAMPPSHHGVHLRRCLRRVTATAGRRLRAAPPAPMPDRRGLAAWSSWEPRRSWPGASCRWSRGEVIHRRKPRALRSSRALRRSSRALRRSSRALRRSSRRSATTQRTALRCPRTCRETGSLDPRTWRVQGNLPGTPRGGSTPEFGERPKAGGGLQSHTLTSLRASTHAACTPSSTW